MTCCINAERDHDDWRYPRQLRWERLVTGPDVPLLLAPSYDRPLLPATTVEVPNPLHTKSAQQWFTNLPDDTARAIMNTRRSMIREQQISDAVLSMSPAARPSARDPRPGVEAVRQHIAAAQAAGQRRGPGRGRPGTAPAGGRSGTQAMHDLGVKLRVSQPSTPTAPGAAQHGSPFGAQHPGALPPPVMQIVAANYAEEMARQKPQQQQQVPGQQGPQQPEGRFKKALRSISPFKKQQQQVDGAQPLQPAAAPAPEDDGQPKPWYKKVFQRKPKDGQGAPGEGQQGGQVDPVQAQAVAAAAAAAAAAPPPPPPGPPVGVFIPDAKLQGEMYTQMATMAIEAQQQRAVSEMMRQQGLSFTTQQRVQQRQQQRLMSGQQPQQLGQGQGSFTQAGQQSFTSQGYGQQPPGARHVPHVMPAASAGGIQSSFPYPATTPLARQLQQQQPQYSYQQAQGSSYGGAPDPQQQQQQQYQQQLQQHQPQYPYQQPQASSYGGAPGPQQQQQQQQYQQQLPQQPPHYPYQQPQGSSYGGAPGLQQQQQHQQQYQQQQPQYPYQQPQGPSYGGAPGLQLQQQQPYHGATPPQGPYNSAGGLPYQQYTGAPQQYPGYGPAMAAHPQPGAPGAFYPGQSPPPPPPPLAATPLPLRPEVPLSQVLTPPAPLPPPQALPAAQRTALGRPGVRIPPTTPSFGLAPEVDESGGPAPPPPAVLPPPAPLQAPRPPPRGLLRPSPADDFGLESDVAEADRPPPPLPLPPPLGANGGLSGPRGSNLVRGPSPLSYNQPHDPYDIPEEPLDATATAAEQRLGLALPPPGPLPPPAPRDPLSLPPPSLPPPLAPAPAPRPLQRGPALQVGPSDVDDVPEDDFGLGAEVSANVGGGGGGAPPRPLALPPARLDGLGGRGRDSGDAFSFGGPGGGGGAVSATPRKLQPAPEERFGLDEEL